MYVVRTTLAPHPPRYLPNPFAIHIFAKKHHHVYNARPAAWVQMLMECTRSAGGQCY